MRGQRIKASRLVLTVVLWSCVLTAAPASAQAPEGEMRWALLFLYVWPSGIGPRVQEAGLMLINPYPWSAPYEDVRLKKP